jgi:hypothetical protein
MWRVQVVGEIAAGAVVKVMPRRHPGRVSTSRSNGAVASNHQTGNMRDTRARAL